MTMHSIGGRGKFRALRQHSKSFLRTIGKFLTLLPLENSLAPPLKAIHYVPSIVCPGVSINFMKPIEKCLFAILSEHGFHNLLYP